MREVGGPLAEVREHRRLDRLDSFRLLGVVGDAVFRAVGVRDEERALAVVAAAGARRHRLTFTFFLPRRAWASSAPSQASVLAPLQASLLDRRLGSCVGWSAAEITQSRGSFSLTEQRPQLESAVHGARRQAKFSFFARVMDAVRLFEELFLWVCAILAALWLTRLALPPLHQAVEPPSAPPSMSVITSIIVTMREPRLSVVPAAAVRGRRADRLVFAPLEPLDVLAALVFMSQMAALPRHVERLAPAFVQRDKKVGAGVAVRDRKVRVRHFRARGRRRRQVVAAAHGCA